MGASTRPTDGALEQLEDTLDGALRDLAKHNRQVEDYLEFLAQERARELTGTEADQLKLDDTPPAAAAGPDAAEAPKQAGTPDL